MTLYAKPSDWLQVFMENGKPSLPRVQSFAWTIVAVIIYTWVVFLTVTDPANLAAVESLGVPNVDTSLAILTGFSQTLYVGGKLAAK